MKWERAKIRAFKLAETGAEKSRSNSHNTKPRKNNSSPSPTVIALIKPSIDSCKTGKEGILNSIHPSTYSVKNNPKVAPKPDIIPNNNKPKFSEENIKP